MNKQILVADIGGTNSRFAHFEYNEQQGLQKKESVWLSSQGVSSFSELLSQLSNSALTLKLVDADICILAAAGPVKGGKYCKPTNVSWDIDLDRDQAICELSRTQLINDFLAQAYACISPIAAQAQIVVPGKPEPKGNIAVIGPGTGLGKAFLVCDPNGSYVGGSSEGAHATFGMEREEEHEFCRFVQEENSLPYLTWEDAVSGRGLSRIHQFLTGKHLEPADAAASFKHQSPTLSWAARLFGRACRNFALETAALGGVFVVGGIAAKNPMLLSDPEFIQAFRFSPIHGNLLGQVPVLLLNNEESGLWGAAFYGAQICIKQR